MKTTFITIYLSIYMLAAFCQTNEWTWVGGDSTTYHSAVFGRRGVAAVANKPGMKDGAVTWTDTSGNLWIFGGYNTQGETNDLWKYNIGTNEWTWESGDTMVNQNGIYGTRGIQAPSNIPGGRERPVTWTDREDNLWLFGGEGYGSIGSNAYLNDLWKYNIASNEWTWVEGDTTIDVFGIFGTRGVAVVSNKPGSRWNAVSWTDTADNLWMFGGYGFVARTVDVINDLWEYNIASNEWIWVNGDSTGGIRDVCGTKGAAAPGNKPGGRERMVSWIDNSDNLWLFGGYGYAFSGGNALLNDLWKYDVTSDQWTWEDGDTVLDVNGIYGTKGTPSAGNRPGSRNDMISWTDNSGNLWLFAGQGYAASGGSSFLNDLWKYVIATGEWTWISGDSVLNSISRYGIKGTPAPPNKPGGRLWSAFWVDRTGNFWLYAGEGFDGNGAEGYLDDLWTFNAGNSMLAPIAQYSASADTICAGSTITFTDQSTGSPVSWSWFFTGGTPDTSTAQNPTITYNAAGTYNVKLVTGNSGGTDSLTKTGYITVDSLPVPVVSTADSLICSSDSAEVCTSGGFVSYAWNTNDTTRCTIVKQAGDYYVAVTDANGCSAVSGHRAISVYPVPSVSITVQGDTLSSFGAISYQWYFNGDTITGANNPVYIASQSGEYAVEITDTNGCKALSNNTQIVITGIDNLTPEGLLIYPDPSVGSWQLTVGNELIGSSIEIYDENGRLVFPMGPADGQSVIRNQLSKISLSVARGIYWLHISNADVSIVRKLVRL